MKRKAHGNWWNERKPSRAHRCDANRNRAQRVTKTQRDRSTLPGLTGRQTRLLKRLADGWQATIIERGLYLIRAAVIGAKYRWADLNALCQLGLIDASERLSVVGKALVDHFGASKPVATQTTPPTPILSVSDWNAMPPSASGKPAPYMALTSEGHLVIQQKRVLAAGNSLSDSEALQRAAANIGKRAVTAQAGA